MDKIKYIITITQPRQFDAMHSTNDSNQCMDCEDYGFFCDPEVEEHSKKVDDPKIKPTYSLRSIRGGIANHFNYQQTGCSEYEERFYKKAQYVFGAITIFLTIVSLYEVFR